MGWTGGVGRFLKFWGLGVRLPCMLAWWSLLSLSGCDACLVIKLTRAPGGKSGLKYGKTSLRPPSIFLVGSHSLKFFWGCLLWHFWPGRARHPGPGSVGIEVLNVAGVGVVSLKGAPLALPTFATPGFERFFGLGRAVRCLFPLGCRRFMHLFFMDILVLILVLRSCS